MDTQKNITWKQKLVSQIENFRHRGLIGPGRQAGYNAISINSSPDTDWRISILHNGEASFLKDPSVPETGVGVLVFPDGTIVQDYTQVEIPLTVLANTDNPYRRIDAVVARYEPSNVEGGFNESYFVVKGVLGTTDLTAAKVAPDDPLHEVIVGWVIINAGEDAETYTSLNYIPVNVPALQGVPAMHLNSRSGSIHGKVMSFAEFLYQSSMPGYEFTKGSAHTINLELNAAQISADSLSSRWQTGIYRMSGVVSELFEGTPPTLPWLVRITSNIETNSITNTDPQSGTVHQELIRTDLVNPMLFRRRGTITGLQLGDNNGGLLTSVPIAWGPWIQITNVSSPPLLSPS